MTDTEISSNDLFQTNKHNALFLISKLSYIVFALHVSFGKMLSNKYIKQRQAKFDRLLVHFPFAKVPMFYGSSNTSLEMKEITKEFKNCIQL